MNFSSQLERRFCQQEQSIIIEKWKKRKLKEILRKNQRKKSLMVREFLQREWECSYLKIAIGGTIYFTEIPTKLVQHKATPEEITKANFDKTAILRQLIEREYKKGKRVFLRKEIN